MGPDRIWLLLGSIVLSIIGVLSIVFRRRLALSQKQQWKLKKVDPGSIGFFDELWAVLFGLAVLAMAAFAFVGFLYSPG